MPNIREMLSFLVENVRYIAGGLVWIPIVSSLVIVTYTYNVKDKMLEAVSQTSEASALKNGVLIESISNLEVIKSLNAMNQFQYMWEATTGEIATKGIKSKQMSAAIGNVSAFVTQFNTVLLIIIGTYMIDAQKLSMGGIGC